MAGVQVPVVRYRIPKYVYRRVLVEVEQKLPEPVRTGLVAWFSSAFNWLLTPIHILVKYLLVVSKPYRDPFLWSCLYICLFLISFKMIVHAILMVGVFYEK